MATKATNNPNTTTGGNYRDGSGDRFVYPREVGSSTNEYPHYIRFIAKKSYTSSEQSKKGKPNGEVVLYMPPDALKTSYSQGIGDMEMGGFISLAQGVGGGAAGALAAGQFAAAGTSGEGEMSAFIQKNLLSKEGGVNLLKDAGKTAATEALKKFASGAAGQAVSKATGQILNPHKAVVYQGPGGFRTFSYTFVMVPKSADEAKEIWQIVRFFKMRMHPGTGSGAGINNLSSVTLTYPDEFEMKYYVNGKEADGFDHTKPLFKIHNCFMESFSADYSTSSLTSFMDDGNPVTTTISMSFKETQLLTKTDIEQGY